MSVHLSGRRLHFSFEVDDEPAMPGRISDDAKACSMTPELLQLSVRDDRLITVSIWGRDLAHGLMASAAFSNSDDATASLDELPEWAARVVRMHARALTLTDEQANVLGELFGTVSFSGWGDSRTAAFAVMADQVRRRQFPL